MFDTDRKGERVSTTDDCDCLRAADAFGLGLFVVDLGLFADLELVAELGVFMGLELLVADDGLGLLFLVLSVTGDRGFDGVRGVRGPFGVGGSRLIKWHGRVIRFLLSGGDCSTDWGRAGRGMRLGEPCGL